MSTRPPRVTLALEPHELEALDRLGPARATAAARVLRLGLDVLRRARACDERGATLESHAGPLARPVPRRWQRRRVV